MKKSRTLTALLCAAVILSSCDSAQLSEMAAPTETTTSVNTTTSAEATTTATEPSESTETEADEPTAEELGAELCADLPRMDGSTSAIPLEIGLKSGFLGISYARAKQLVSHTTTHDSFKRLINGEVDLIFSVPISEEQQKMADEAGVTLYMEPIAKEGFVFVVNAENPVDSLTSEQLRGIYSGEITNWSQVGGNDEPILPYQRNTDSGSQNYITVFMGDTPLLEPKKETVQGFMLSLMDAVATYDNSAGAIGYSVYSYAAQMYANANRVKFIAVDGVAPSKATMADESYPLLSCTYAIYTDKSAESAREFVQKALSDEGQGYVLDSGYLPVNGMEVPEKYLPYEAVGTGAPKPADFTPDREYSTIYVNADKTEDGYYQLSILKDEAFQDRINADIRAAMDGLKQYADPNDPEWTIYCVISIINGYCSILLGCPDRETEFLDYNDIEYHSYAHAATLNYDLFAQKKIERFSDFFFEGEDFMTDLNNAIKNSLETEVYPYVKDAQKLDFSGILGEPRLFTLDRILFEPDNPYLTFMPALSYWDSNTNRMICLHSPIGQYRDCWDVLSESTRKSSIYTADHYFAEWKTGYLVENGALFEIVTDSSFHTEEEIAAENAFRCGLQARAREAFASVGYDWQTETSYMSSISFGKHGNYYYVGTASPVAGDVPHAHFDADTLELITPEMLLGEDWRKYLPRGENAPFYILSNWWHGYEGDKATVLLIAKREEDESRHREEEQSFYGVEIEVPYEIVNPRY